MVKLARLIGQPYQKRQDRQRLSTDTILLPAIGKTSKLFGEALGIANCDSAKDVLSNALDKTQLESIISRIKLEKDKMGSIGRKVATTKVLFHTGEGLVPEEARYDTSLNQALSEGNVLFDDAITLIGRNINALDGDKATLLERIHTFNQQRFLKDQITLQQQKSQLQRQFDDDTTQLAKIKENTLGGTPTERPTFTNDMLYASTMGMVFIMECLPNYDAIRNAFSFDPSWNIALAAILGLFIAAIAHWLGSAIREKNRTLVFLHSLLATAIFAVVAYARSIAQNIDNDKAGEEGLVLNLVGFAIACFASWNRAQDHDYWSKKSDMEAATIRIDEINLNEEVIEQAISRTKEICQADLDSWLKNQRERREAAIDRIKTQERLFRQEVQQLFTAGIEDLREGVRTHCEETSDVYPERKDYPERWSKPAPPLSSNSGPDD